MLSVDPFRLEVARGGPADWLLHTTSSLPHPSRDFALFSSRFGDHESHLVRGIAPSLSLAVGFISLWRNFCPQPSSVTAPLWEFSLHNRSHFESSNPKASAANHKPSTLFQSPIRCDTRRLSYVQTPLRNFKMPVQTVSHYAPALQDCRSRHSASAAPISHHRPQKSVLSYPP